jgi:hypothetical protein
MFGAGQLQQSPTLQTHLDVKINDTILVKSVIVAQTIFWHVGYVGTHALPKNASTALCRMVNLSADHIGTLLIVKCVNN